MPSTCHRASYAPSRLVGVLALCAAPVLAPESALAEQVRTSAPAPAAPPDAPQPPLAAPTHPSRSALQQADAAFQQGLALLEAGRYDEACERFELSQQLDPSPGTQLNLGNCREREGNLVQALATFEQALDGAREAPDPRRRQLWSDAARERIASLTPRVSVRGAPEGAREPQPAAPRSEAGLESQQALARHGAWPYVLGGVGAVLLGTSLVTGLEASAARDELERDCTGKLCAPSLKPTRDRADRLAALTDVFWITGVIAAGAGMTLFVLDLGHEQAGLEAGCFGSGCGLRARGSF